MSCCAVLLAAALTRAEIIERMRRPPVTKVSGLVQVVASCPADMRLEYQSPVATFAADVCTKLYAARREQPKAFPEPGIVIYLGDGRTNDTRVVVWEGKHASGSPYTRLTLPAPGSSDLESLRLEVVRAFYRSLTGETIDDTEAERRLLEADPDRRADRQYEMIERWLNGEPVEADDEEMLRLSRSVLQPGIARPSDVLRFASRLALYPESYDRPFCGRYRSCTFAEAIRLAEKDPRLRLIAYLKAPQLIIYGGGRGEELALAAEAYANLMFELAKGKKSKAALEEMLAEADAKLEAAMEAARKVEEGKGR